MMAEVGIVLSREEEANLVKLALSMKAWLTPDLDYVAPWPIRIKTYDDYKVHRQRARLFFILHDSFFVAPLEMRKIEKGGRSVYFIMQRNGGPTIDFLSTVEYEEHGKTHLGPGFLAYHRTFWNPKSEANEVPSEGLISFFKELTRTVKKASIRTKVGVRTYWIGKATTGLLEKGIKHLGVSVRRSSSAG